MASQWPASPAASEAVRAAGAAMQLPNRAPDALEVAAALPAPGTRALSAGAGLAFLQLQGPCVPHGKCWCRGVGRSRPGRLVREPAPVSSWPLAAGPSHRV